MNYINFRDWKRWVADEIQKNINSKGELMRAEAWATIDNICQKTVQDLNSILIKFEEFQTKVLPIDHYRRKNLREMCLIYTECADCVKLRLFVDH